MMKLVLGILNTIGSKNLLHCLIRLSFSEFRLNNERLSRYDKPGEIIDRARF